MNRLEFMSRLELLLNDITSSERREALKYYNDYFDDAGLENEAMVIEELDTPEKVANTIKEGLGISQDKMFGSTSNENNSYKDTYNQNQGNQQYANQQQTTNTQHSKGRNNTGIYILIAIVTSPIWLAAFLGLMGGLLGVVMGFFAIIFATAILSIVLFICGIVLFCFAMIKMFVGPIGALCMAGIAMMFIGVGMLCYLAAKVLAFTVIPGIARGLGRMIRWILGERGVCAA